MIANPSLFFVLRRIKLVVEVFAYTRNTVVLITLLHTTFGMERRGRNFLIAEVAFDV